MTEARKTREKGHDRTSGNFPCGTWRGCYSGWHCCDQRAITCAIKVAPGSVAQVVCPTDRIDCVYRGSQPSWIAVTGPTIVPVDWQAAAAIGEKWLAPADPAASGYPFGRTIPAAAVRLAEGSAGCLARADITTGEAGAQAGVGRGAAR